MSSSGLLCSNGAATQLPENIEAPSELSKGLIHRAIDPAVHALEDVGIGVEGKGYGGMS